MFFSLNILQDNHQIQIRSVSCIDFDAVIKQICYLVLCIYLLYGVQLIKLSLGNNGCIEMVDWWQYLIIDYISMGRGTKKGQTQATTRNHNSKTNIGRPQDDRLETFFMKKLRNGKLQVITAQSEAEIACYNYKDSTPSLEDNHSEQKVSYIKKWFEEKDQSRFKLLWKGFVSAAEKWQFKQINSISDFPEFLFCDQCDLSYVLDEILRSETPILKQKKQFANEELLYLELLCFATRDQISFRVIKSIQSNYQYFVEKLMENVNTLVIKYSKEISREEKNQANVSQFGSSEAIPNSLRKGQVKNDLSRIENPGLNSKTKQIEKGDKNDKKRGRPKKNSQLRQDDILELAQLQQVGQKLISHMVRAYAYIYPSQTQQKGTVMNNEQKAPSKTQDIVEED